MPRRYSGSSSKKDFALSEGPTAKRPIRKCRQVTQPMGYYDEGRSFEEKTDEWPCSERPLKKKSSPQKREESESSEWEDISLGSNHTVCCGDLKSVKVEIEKTSIEPPDRVMRGCIARLVRDFRVQCHQTALVCAVAHCHYLLGPVLDLMKALKMSVKIGNADLILSVSNY
ncbi:hypothetical protein ACOME3_000171 [Neoechinorhynchus agilis]